MLSEHNDTFRGVNEWLVLGGLKWSYGFVDIFHALLDGLKAFVHAHDCIINLDRCFRVHSFCLWLVSKFLYLEYARLNIGHGVGKLGNVRRDGQRANVLLTLPFSLASW
jgi:hypothetical protein